MSKIRRCLSDWHIYVSASIFLGGSAFIHYAWFYHTHGYLPTPFLYDKSDTFMDLFNPMYWAYNDGRYTVWHSTYPPINFILLRVANFLFSGAKATSAAGLRAGSPFVIACLVALYLAIPAVVLRARYWLQFSVKEKITIYLAVILSVPMLFTLERGNLILFAPLLLAAALSSKGVARCLYIAVLINLKPYFALLSVYYLVRKEWKLFAICVSAAAVIFLVTGVALDRHFYDFFPNLFMYVHGMGIHSLRETMALPSSISAFSFVLSSPAGAAFASKHLSTSAISVLVDGIESVKWMVLIAAMAVLVKSAKMMRASEMLLLLVVLISNLGTWVGGYTYIFYFALIPVICRLEARAVCIGLLLLLAAPIDVVPLLSASIGQQYSYLAGTEVNVWWTLGLGSLVRPVANLTLLLLLSWVFLTRSEIPPGEAVTSRQEPIQQVVGE